MSCSFSNSELSVQRRYLASADPNFRRFVLGCIEADILEETSFEIIFNFVRDQQDLVLIYKMLQCFRVNRFEI